MTTTHSNRSTLQRWLALVVRYWAVNMTMIHDRKNNWPGFGYTDAEKAELRTMGGQVTNGEFYWFTGVLVVLSISLFAVVVVTGMNMLLTVIGGEQNMPNTPASLFFLSLALEAILCLTIVLPLAMIPSAEVVGRWYNIANEDLPDEATTARYFHKLWFQIARMSIIMTCAVLPLWIFVPNDSKFMVAIRLIVPLLSPVVSGLTVMFYYSTRLKRANNV
jgi:hypothetical protein